MDWASDQRHIMPWSVQKEVWVPGARLRSDVKAEIFGGRQLAFEVQRKPMDAKEWDRRHGGYQSADVLAVWLWSPDVPELVLDLPLASVVLDLANEELGVLVADYAGQLPPPHGRGPHHRTPIHYAAAPLTEWGISASGSLVPPPGMAEYIAISLNRPDLPSSMTTEAHPRSHPSSRGSRRRPRQVSTGSPSVPGGRDTVGRAPYIEPEREEQCKQEAIKQIMRRKR